MLHIDIFIKNNNITSFTDMWQLLKLVPKKHTNCSSSVADGWLAAVLLRTAVQIDTGAAWSGVGLGASCGRHTGWGGGMGWTGICDSGSRVTSLFLFSAWEIKSTRIIVSCLKQKLSLHYCFMSKSLMKELRTHWQLIPVSLFCTSWISGSDSQQPTQCQTFVLNMSDWIIWARKNWQADTRILRAPKD